MRPSRPVLASLLAFTVACSGSNAFVTPPSEDLELDAVRFLGEQVGAAVSLAVEADEEVTRPRTDPTAPAPAQAVGEPAPTCTYSGVSTRWTCTGVGTGGNVAGTVTLQFRNAAGQARPVYDAATTASVVIGAEMAGSVARNGFTADAESAHDLVVSGLAGEETFRLWNGDGSATLDARIGGTRRYTVTSVDSVQGLRFDLPHDANRYPDAGSVVVRMTARLTEQDGQSVSGSIGRRFVITFDGDETATVSVGSRTYVLNLATRAVTGS